MSRRRKREKIKVEKCKEMRTGKPVVEHWEMMSWRHKGWYIMSAFLKTGHFPELHPGVMRGGRGDAEIHIGLPWV